MRFKIYNINIIIIIIIKGKAFSNTQQHMIFWARV